MDLATAGITDMGATLGSLKALLDTPVSALRRNHRPGAARCCNLMETRLLRK
jgi:hypothetical protein